MDLEALLAARDGDEPSGENLEYDFDFMQLQIAAQPGEERQAGNEILAAEDPDFKDVEAQALGILERAHDLRAAVILANAVLHTKGLKGFAEAVAYIKGCLEQHWDTCHPQLDADDDNDPTMRINAVKGLGGSDSVLSSLRRAALTNSRNFWPTEPARHSDCSRVRCPRRKGRTRNTTAPRLRRRLPIPAKRLLGVTLAAIKSALSDVKAIEGIFSDKTPGYGPDLDDLRKMLQQLSRHVSEHVAAPAEAESSDDDADEAEGGDADDGPAAAPARRGAGGGVVGIGGNCPGCKGRAGPCDRLFQTP